MQLVGVVLDHHYVETVLKQQSLHSWNIGVLESALLGACVPCDDPTEREITRRFACDSANSSGALSKRKKHEELRSAGYELLLSENKRSSDMPIQGAVDVSIVSCLYHLAGAFANEPPVHSILLLAGDSDMMPALEHVISSRHELHVVIVASAATMKNEYLRFVRERCHFVDLLSILRTLHPEICNLERENLPTISTDHRLDPTRAAQRITESMRSLRDTHQPGGQHDSVGAGTVVQLRNLQKRFGDAECSALVSKLLERLDDESINPELLSQCWLHHNDISDASTSVLARLVRRAKLNELHISDTNVSPEGLHVLEDAARDAASKLYINAKHIHPSECNKALLQSTAVSLRLNTKLIAAGGDHTCKVAPAAHELAGDGVEHLK